MKNLMIILTLIFSTVLSAQNRPIQIEVVDRTEITMLAAQYDIMQREQRQRINAQNFDIAIKNFSSFTSSLGELEKFTNDPKILKEIKKAHQQNERLYNLATRSSYTKEFYKMKNTIDKIAISVNAYKE